MAAKLWTKFGNEEKAKALSVLAKQLGGHGHAPAKKPEKKPAPAKKPEKKHHAAAGREALQHRLEVMGIAIHGLREANRRDAIEVMERAIHAAKMDLAGRKDDEAHMIRERAPSREILVKVLATAAKQWREYGQEEKAKAVGQLAEKLAARKK
jgi:hypothetical protein